ncbi:D-alanyl-D-alanine carboxypeptidase [Rhizobium sp. XQZ8]|uniref:D-alanyl-D-alanine carboxypeptidase family protein n=1 Tax=Rhizobium populisoli TaxID=2859785 RepID=UPI001C6770DB|nr:D-alanyl-D-alanine carboxypeptidase family protein [Rhizobium populisoli]MBW6423133.1 D-alanyl-D-alanine carboxypeptidase [Rhizobium populisoli]
MFRISRVVAWIVLLGASLAFGRTAQADYAHFIYDVKSGKVLTQDGADELNHPASLTKMMTLYMTFEALRDRRISWDQDILITPNAASKIPSKLGVPEGKTITVREAVNGMIVRSANDAAAAMGDYFAGTEERFGEMMTKRARALGMSRTVFKNASGLPDDAQVTTARDMAVLALALIRDFPREYAMFSAKNMEFRGKRLRGHNNLMYRYPGMDGVKTGYIKASGFNIASAVNINGRRYIGVVMGGKTARIRDDRMAALLDQYVPGNGAPADGALVAYEEQKRPGEGAAAALAMATPTPTPRKEITLGTAAAPARASMTNLYATAQPQQPIVQQPVGPIVGVQIAAAGTREAATALLEQALPVLSGNYGRLAPSVENYAEGGKQYFRARLLGFADAGAAGRACAALQAKSMNCFVVR